MKKRFVCILFLVAAIGVISLPSCKKDQLFSKEHLSFSADTVLFDTIFTTIGSTTQRFKVYNSSKKPIVVNEIRLKGGESSPYRINVDGIAGIVFNDIEIPAEDSLFVFVEVTLGANSLTTPLIVEDQVLFTTNGKEQHVQLTAWGRDAYFHYKDSNSGIWNNDKPHVIYGYAAIDSNKTLTIPAGTEVYLHKNAMLYVYYGRLIIDGDYTNKVTFQGDRLEEYYADKKGQYYGIYLHKALSSTIDNAVIKNGTVGVHLFGDNEQNSDYTLRITNTEIANNLNYGIFNYAGGRVYGENLSIHNNGYYAYFVLEGGDCNFRHSQFLGYGADNNPAIAIKNYHIHAEDQSMYVGAINELHFYNSIIYGDGETQIGFDTLKNQPTATISCHFESNLIRQKNIPSSNPDFVNNLWNQNPRFQSVADQKYIIRSNSPCVDAGNTGYAVPLDIEGNARVGLPDIGSYENQ